MKKKLALGSQEFSEVIGNNCIYVDKTENIHTLVATGKYYFLSRPRRFGKSLLCNTLKELFLGNKELFKDLWIYDNWDWETIYPVIKISFSNIDHEKLGLEQAISDELDIIANKCSVALKRKTVATKFKELIIKLSEKAQVAIIIDEYDKPIIDYLDDLETAEKNRQILKNFYSVLKDADKHIKFLFITGVSKFSKVSIFSDLNNLEDITINENYTQIVGWTKQEIEDYFMEYVESIKMKFEGIYLDIMMEIKNWYNGYSWDGITHVYNPVSLMNLFKNRDFRNYWFETGTPTMLMNIIKNRKLTAFDIENTYTSSRILDKYDFKNIDFNSLLFQTGYLTIKNYDLAFGEITLGYPNKEVAQSFSENILSVLTSDRLEETDNLLHRIRRSFMHDEMDKFIKYVNIIFKDIPYTIIDDKEKYYHSLFYLIMKLTGYKIDAEVLTIDGRIDAVVRTDDNIFIIEFKIDQSAQKAIEQIKNKKYAEKYADGKRQVTLLGINFDTEKKRVDDYILET